MSHTLFISDLHLCDSKPDTTNHFIEFLKNDAPSAEALYILGDFFEVWAGDDCTTAMSNKVEKALSEFTQQTRIPTYFMHGNRDFLISQKFTDRTGIKLIADPTPIDLYGKKILLTHGDFLCIDDIKYQRMRRFTSKKWFRKVLMMLSKTTRQKIAANERHKSKLNHNMQRELYADINTHYAKEHCNKHHCNFLIHGHTHMPQVNYLSKQQQVYRMTLSSWDDKPGYGLVSQNKFELHYFSK